LLDEQSFKIKPQTIDIPHFAYPDAERVTGTLQIVIDEMFLLQDILLKGYLPSEASLTAQSNHSKDKNLFYEFRARSTKGQINLSLRKAEQTAKTVTYVTVDEALLQTNAFIKYEVSAGKKDSFYIPVVFYCFELCC